MNQNIEFDSTPDQWHKEYNGIKRNTVRIPPPANDPRCILLANWKEGNGDTITIRNTMTGIKFTKPITDVTFYDSRWIISW